MSWNMILPASTEKERDPTQKYVRGHQRTRNLLAMLLEIELTSRELRKVM